MKISVIITCYNREKTISRCIESVLNQDYPDFEIVVVDDGSSDGTPEILEGLQAAFLSRMKVIRQENGGVAAARNTGLAEASGDYVTYLDSDDYMAEGALSLMAEATNGGDMDQVLFDAYQSYEDGKTEYYRAYHDGASLDMKQGELTPNQLILSNPCPWNRLMKKELWAKVFGNRPPFPEGLLYEDLATIPMLAVFTKKSYYLEKPLIYYCQSAGSIMRQKGYNPHYDDIFKVADRLRKALSFQFPVESEYLIWEHLLVSGGKRYLACGKKQLMIKCAEYMKQNYENWAKNPLVKREPAKKQALARLIYDKKFLTLKLLGK